MKIDVYEWKITRVFSTIEGKAGVETMARLGFSIPEVLKLKQVVSTKDGRWWRIEHFDYSKPGWVLVTLSLVNGGRRILNMMGNYDNIWTIGGFRIWISRVFLDWDV